MTKKPNNFQCPVCSSPLIMHRSVDRDDRWWELDEEGDYKPVGDKFNGYLDFFCKSDQEHEIPDEQKEYLTEQYLDLL